MSESFTIQHHFINDEVYLREFVIPENRKVKQHKHKYDHVTLLAKGNVLVRTHNKEQSYENMVRYTAPAYIFIEKEVAHSITAFNGEARLYCTHITDCTNEELIDEALIHEAVA